MVMVVVVVVARNVSKQHVFIPSSYLDRILQLTIQMLSGSSKEASCLIEFD